ncbi:uncharacterized protein EV420DRAFT_254353 [Desarmillaria tabescens]|uniref:Uncharacterized protein n=1 Tax=Armillaria tabescens TaxID=1929756 RepID=A0AA39N7C3_ARMTA|nr:uncharacterized protein EV420DRAFT_254353 [Desarmillaria tabescens]KAK0460175.1 hypothetical protein EV420DRAFT_254353 [Desarmillaria tabescens]
MDVYVVRDVIAIFNCLQLLGLILLLAVLVPALFSAHIHRMRTWHAMVISGIVYNFGYMLLMILGRQLGPAPSFALCLFQSCLIYCAPVLLVSFSLAFVIEVFLVLTDAIYGIPLASSTRVHKLLLAVPSLIYMIVFSTTLLIGLQERETVKRDEWSLYCHSAASSPTLITATFVLIEASTMIILQVSMVIILWKNKRRLKSNGANDNLSLIFPLSLFFRSLMFAVYILLGIGISASIIPSPTGSSPVWKMTLTTPPIAMALSFGTQKDTIAFYWRYKRDDYREGIGSNKLV